MNLQGETLARYRAFYQSPERGQLLITVPPYTFPAATNGRERRPLTAWDPHAQAEQMAEESVAFERWYAEYTRAVRSDYIPAVCPDYGIGVISAFLSDAPVRPGVDTSWVRPVLDDWSRMDGLAFRPDNRWVEFMRRYQRRALALCEGDYCVASLCFGAPSDMANALRGNALFLDLYDAPERVDELLARCAEALLAAWAHLKPDTWAPEGGFAAGGLWMPGEGLFLSEDAADLCAPAAYAAHFGPRTQRVLDGIGGAYVHHHALGWKVHREIAKLRGLKFLEFSWDPNCPRPVDHLEEVMEDTGNVPLQLRMTARDVYKYIDVLKQGRFALMVNVDGLDEARDVVRFVRKNSKI